jgi:F5/8 type C domain
MGLILSQWPTAARDPGTPGGHKWWRLQIDSTLSNVVGTSIRTLEFRESIGGPDICVGGTASASSTLGGFPASNAFDTNFSTQWQATAVAAPHYIAYEFATPKDVYEVHFVGGNVGGIPDAFSIDFSDNGSAWTEYFSSTTGWAAADLSRTVDFS